MALWSIYKKPTYLSTAEKAATAATESGWELTRSDGTKEVIVSIGELATKQHPYIRQIATDKNSYNLELDSKITFDVFYSAAISENLSSASVLPFTLGLGSLEAGFVSSDANKVTFEYTIPNFAGRDAILDLNDVVTSIETDTIVLDGVEAITLDTNVYPGDLTASLITGKVLPVTTTRTFQAPSVIDVTLEGDPASIAFGGTPDTTIDFLVHFDYEIAETLSAATVLNFTIESSNLTAEYDSLVDVHTIKFSYTIPALQADRNDIVGAGNTATAIALTSITLDGVEEVTYIDSNNALAADLTLTPTSITIDIINDSV